jgi:hypothetical protein
MNLEQKLLALRDAVQIDVADRGLARDPEANLFNAFPDDFARACRSLAEHPSAVLGVITGFYIPAAKHGETDGPLGAVYLARTLPFLGIRVQLASDPFCRRALRAGLKKCRRLADTPVVTLPREYDQGDAPGLFWECDEHYPPMTVRPPTHLLALERVGPSHTLASLGAQPGANDETVRRFLAEVPEEHHDRCHTMRGIDITEHVRDAPAEFDRSGWAYPDPPVTIGVGDGGNEIGMGKVPWDVIRRNIPRGAVIACRVATDHLLVAGVSNWGAYALAAGVALLRGVTPPAEWSDLDLEREILETMVEQGPLVDGVSGTFSASVDGLAFEEYAAPLSRIAAIVRG